MTRAGWLQSIKALCCVLRCSKALWLTLACPVGHTTLFKYIYHSRDGLQRGKARLELSVRCRTLPWLKTSASPFRLWKHCGDNTMPTSLPPSKSGTVLRKKSSPGTCTLQRVHMCIAKLKEMRGLCRHGLMLDFVPLGHSFKMLFIAALCIFALGSFTKHLCVTASLYAQSQRKQV